MGQNMKTMKAFYRFLKFYLLSLSLCFHPFNLWAQNPNLDVAGMYQRERAAESARGPNRPVNSAPTNNTSNSMMGSINPFMGNSFGGGQAGQQGSGPLMALMAIQQTGNLVTQVLNSSAQASMTAAMLANQTIRAQNARPVADSIFPECKTMPAQESHFDDTACAPNSIRGAGDKFSAMRVISLAQEMRQNYELVNMEGKAVNNSKGLQCYKERSKSLVNQLHQDRETLKTKMDEINQAREKFKADMQPQLDAMKNANNELRGTGQGPGNAEDRKRDFTSTFGNPK